MADDILPGIPTAGPPRAPVLTPRNIFDITFIAPARRRRGCIIYHTLRAWYAFDRRRAMDILRAVKREREPSIVAQAAAETGRHAARLADAAGWRGDCHVTAVPCGHSGRDCFGRRLALEAAAALGLPFVELFAARPVRGKSHPRRNAQLPPLELVAAVPERIILLDDIATSGRHLEEAAAALKEGGAGAVLPVAWLGRPRRF